MPQPGDVGGQTWAAGPLGFATGGATVWNTPSVDPARNMIVFTTGNAAPWSGRGPGANLFTSSYVALNATTGQIMWWYQLIHHDIWDYDCPSPTVMMDATVAGVSTPVVAEPCKTGWVYELNRTTGLTILLIEHVMRAVMALAERVLVLHHGAAIVEGAPAAVVREPAVVQSYLGAEAID